MGRGLVFEIREFCVHDGPGVRTTVFLQGCPLRCEWCQNPEGQSLEPVLLFSAAKCIHCGACARVCPHGTQRSQCTSCGACVTVCPEGCRRLCGTWYDAQDLAVRLNRGRELLEASGGGVTFSGGEPLVQGEFILDVARRLRPLSQCLETCGHCESGLYRRVVSELDLIYQDVKLVDSAAHRRYTGVGNELILENVRWLLRESGKPCVIRVPLIPGVTDVRENLQGVADLVRGAPWLQEVQLLPYNFAAGAKYHLLGRTYAPSFDVSAACRPDLSVFAKQGIPFRLM